MKRNLEVMLGVIILVVVILSVKTMWLKIENDHLRKALAEANEQIKIGNKQFAEIAEKFRGTFQKLTNDLEEVSVQMTYGLDSNTVYAAECYADMMVEHQLAMRRDYGRTKFSENIPYWMQTRDNIRNHNFRVDENGTNGIFVGRVSNLANVWNSRTPEHIESERKWLERSYSRQLFISR